MVNRPAAVLALATSGCSWLLMYHLPDGHRPSDVPYCSTSRGTAVADYIFGAVDVLVAAAFAASPELNAPEKTGPIVANFAQAVLFGASALTGEAWSRECRRARADAERREPARSLGDAAYGIGTEPAKRKVLWCVEVNRERSCFDSAEACERQRQVAISAAALVQGGCARD